MPLRSDGPTAFPESGSESGSKQAFSLHYRSRNTSYDKKEVKKAAEEEMRKLRRTDNSDRYRVKKCSTRDIRDTTKQILKIKYTAVLFLAANFSFSHSLLNVYHLVLVPFQSLGMC